jgi:hypothetical protein
MPATNEHSLPVSAAVKCPIGAGAVFFFPAVQRAVRLRTSFNSQLAPSPGITDYISGGSDGLDWRSPRDGQRPGGQRSDRSGVGPHCHSERLWCNDRWLPAPRPGPDRTRLLNVHVGARGPSASGSQDLCSSTVARPILAEPGAAPNGGPAAQCVNPSVTEGPPSVSFAFGTAMKPTRFQCFFASPWPGRIWLTSIPLAVGSCVGALCASFHSPLSRWWDLLRFMQQPASPARSFAR